MLNYQNKKSLSLLDASKILQNLILCYSIIGQTFLLLFGSRTVMSTGTAVTPQPAAGTGLERKTYLCLS